MVLGGVYFFVSDRVIGHESRPKLHVYLTESDDWHEEGHSFLFISSGDYGGDFPIKLADYPEFLTHDSFIGSGLAFYGASELSGRTPKHVGNIKPEHLSSLRNHLAGSDVMVQWQINLACRALDAAR